MEIGLIVKSCINEGMLLLLFLWPEAESLVLASVSFLFLVLSSLLAAKHDKYMRRGLRARPEPSGNDIGQSTFLVSCHIGLTVTFFLDMF